MARSYALLNVVTVAVGHGLDTPMRRSTAAKQLDLETLVATRGPNFPLGRLEGRLMCPACGNRRVTVVFEPPSNAQVGRV